MIPTRLHLEYILDHSPKEWQVFDDLEVASYIRYPRNVGAKLAVRDLFVHIPDASFNVPELFGKVGLSVGAGVVAVVMSAFSRFRKRIAGHRRR